MEILTKKNLYRVVCTYGYKSSTYVKRKKIKTALQQILKLLTETCLRHFFIQVLWGRLVASFTANNFVATWSTNLHRFVDYTKPF